MANNVLHRKLSMSHGLNDLKFTIMPLCTSYDVHIPDRGISHVWYIVRDTHKIMNSYLKAGSLQAVGIVAGEISSRMDFSPAVSTLNTLCRKLLRQKIIF